MRYKNKKYITDVPSKRQLEYKLGGENTIVTYDHLLLGDRNFVQSVYNSVINPSEELTFEIVKFNGTNIAMLKEPSVTLQLESVKQNVFNFTYIRMPAEEVQIYVIEKYIEHIKNHPIMHLGSKEKIISNNFNRMLSRANLTKKAKSKLMEYNPLLLVDFEKLSVDECLKIIENDLSHILKFRKNVPLRVLNDVVLRIDEVSDRYERRKIIQLLSTYYKKLTPDLKVLIKLKFGDVGDDIISGKISI